MDKERIRLEYDNQTNHRVCVGELKGEWALYSHPSMLVVGDKTYIGFSEYYETSADSLGGKVYASEIVTVVSQPHIVKGTRPR
jgi:hypothetical protein